MRDDVRIRIKYGKSLDSEKEIGRGWVQLFKGGIKFLGFVNRGGVCGWDGNENENEEGQDVALLVFGLFVNRFAIYGYTALHLPLPLFYPVFFLDFVERAIPLFPIFDFLSPIAHRFVQSSNFSTFALLLSFCSAALFALLSFSISSIECVSVLFDAGL